MGRALLRSAVMQIVSGYAFDHSHMEVVVVALASPKCLLVAWARRSFFQVNTLLLIVASITNRGDTGIVYTATNSFSQRIDSCHCC